MLAALVFLCIIGVCNGCTPLNIHYQDSYCNADIAAVIRVDRVVTSNAETDNGLIPRLIRGPGRYRGTVEEVMKGSPYIQIGSRVNLLTPNNPCMRMTLTVGATYMILGDRRGNAISVFMYNGRRQLQNDQETSSMRQRVNSYDCRCEIYPMTYRRVNELRGTSPSVPDNQCSIMDSIGCGRRNSACVMRSGKCQFICV